MSYVVESCEGVKSCKIKSSAGRNAVYGQTILGTDRVIVQSIPCWYVVLLNGNCFFTKFETSKRFYGRNNFHIRRSWFSFQFKQIVIFSRGSKFFLSGLFFWIISFLGPYWYFWQGRWWLLFFFTVFIMVVIGILSNYLDNWDVPICTIGTFFVLPAKLSTDSSLSSKLVDIKRAENATKKMIRVDFLKLSKKGQK